MAVSGVKILNGRDMEAGEFTFTLTQIDHGGREMEEGAHLIVSNAAKAAGEPAPFAFAPLSYDLDAFENAGDHDQDGKALFYYLVEEMIPADAEDHMKDGIIYCTDRYLVVVRLAYTGGNLTAEKEYYVYDGAIPDALKPVETPVQS